MERLSRDVMIEIISRLPMKYVLRCKSVSKSWEAHLSDPLFAAAHFTRASALTPFSADYITREDKKLLYFIETEEEDNNETSTISKHLIFPFLTCCLTRFLCPILMGSCLGYVCFSTRDMFPGPTNPMYLFNPITGASILLPQFEEIKFFSCVYGFGLDVSRQEPKVVLVYLLEKVFLVQVHTVGGDCSWRTHTVPSMFTDATDADLMKDELQTSLPLGFNGSIHWIVSGSVDREKILGARRASILSFQLNTEVLGVISMPEPLQVVEPYYHNSMMYALQVCGGCLSIIYSPEASVVDMWVMADYNISDSWVKTYSIQLNCMGDLKLGLLGFERMVNLCCIWITKGWFLITLTMIDIQSSGRVRLHHFHSRGVSFLSNPPMETARLLAHLGLAIQFRSSSGLYTF